MYIPGVSFTMPEWVNLSGRVGFTRPEWVNLSGRGQVETLGMLHFWQYHRFWGCQHQGITKSNTPHPACAYSWFWPFFEHVWKGGRYWVSLWNHVCVYGSRKFFCDVLASTKVCWWSVRISQRQDDWVMWLNSLHPMIPVIDKYQSTWCHC